MMMGLMSAGKLQLAASLVTNRPTSLGGGGGDGGLGGPGGGEGGAFPGGQGGSRGVAGG